MAEVRYGPARVSFSGNEAAARAHLPRAMKLLRQTQERARLGGLSVLGNQWALDDDSYCYVVLAGGIAAVHVVSGYADEGAPSPVVPVEIPDFVSGVIQNGHILDVPATMTTPGYKTLEKFHPTQRCADDYKLPHAYQAMQRLAVEPWTAFDELRNNSPSGQPVYSQYTKLKPTMYSGTMRQVVQALMGFGRQRRKGKKEFSRYDQKRGGSAPQAKPGKYQKDVTKDGLQIRYDWRFSRTHGITRAGDGRLWLVEIGINAGVLAMPLPLHEATTTPAFRERMEKAGDEDAMALLDAFGGFPTGEAFPPAAEREAWIRAGKVLHLAEPSALTPFYQCSAYSSAMGWAFNAKGSEAHNTAYFYGDDGYMRGIHDAVNLSIGATVKVTPARQAGVLKERLAKLRGEKEYADRIEAAIWKVDRMSELQVKSALWWGDAAHAFDEVDALELAPLASGRASRTRIGEGHLWHNPWPTGCLLKVHEPSIDMLVAIGMQPVPETLPMVRCDTTVHVFFAGNELKYLRFWADPRTVAPRTQDDYEQCMNVGAWSAYSDTGTHYPPAFYSSDMDDRVEDTGTTTTTNRVSTDLGWSRSLGFECPFGGLAPFWWHRVRRFRDHIVTRQFSAGAVDFGAVVPEGDREAYVYGVYQSSAQSWERESVGYHYLDEPWKYVMAKGCGYHPDCKVEACPPVGSPPPKTALAKHNPCASEVLDGVRTYSWSPCADDADKDIWYTTPCEVATPWPVIPEPPSSSKYTETNRTSEYRVVLLSSSERSGLEITSMPGDAWFTDWYKTSPFNGNAETSSDQRFEVGGNVLGDADSVRYSKDINFAPTILGTPAWDEMLAGELTYIGVIDGG